MEPWVHHLRELWAERGRVGLVVLGVVWGTLSLTLLLAFGHSFVESTTETGRSFGTNLLRVSGGSTTRPFEGHPAGRRIALYPEDADAVAAALPDLAGVAVEYQASGAPLQHGDVRLNVSLSGCSPSFRDLRRQYPDPGGRYLNQRDEAEHRQVIFLGGRTKRTLFGDADAVGRTVQLYDRPFVVVGVLQPKITGSSYNGEDRDKVAIPASTFRDLFDRRQLSMLWARMPNRESRHALRDEVVRVLAARHGFDPADENALEVHDYVEIEELFETILAGNTIFLRLVGVIGLIVALVGVANVTYVMVEERTREIGVQIALGARPRDVAAARLVEGMLVTLVGGCIGIATSAVILAALAQVGLGPEVRAYLGYPRVSVPLAAGIVLVLVVGGCVAGWIPARRAAALDPVVALREE